MRTSAAVGVDVNLAVEVADALTGEVVERQVMHNLVTNAGLNMIRDLISTGTGSSITHLAVGTGTTAASATQTAMVTEVVRYALTTSTTSAQTMTVSLFLTSTQANGSTLAEVGLFTAASVGTMFARAVLASTIAKTSSIVVTFTWTITLAAA